MTLIKLPNALQRKLIVHLLWGKKWSFDPNTRCCDSVCHSKIVCCLSGKNHVLHQWADHQSITSDKQLIVLAQRDREREHTVVIVGNRGHKKIMISLLCKWQLKDTKCCRRCPCISRLVLIGTHTAAESLWPLTLICQNEAEGRKKIWHYALNQLRLMKKSDQSD